MTSNPTVLIAIMAAALCGACSNARAADDKTTATASVGATANKETKPGRRKVKIAVTGKGFEPDTITVRKGQPVELVFTRKTDEACIKEVVLETADTEKIQKPLPLNKPVTIKATFIKARDYKFTCNMETFSGTVIVQ